jgi:hypothetical protein
MCYTRKDHSLEEEARKRRTEEEFRLHYEENAIPDQEKQDKTLAEKTTKKVKELIGVSR